MLVEIGSGANLAEWEAFAQLEPFGAWREDYRIATLCQTVAALAGAKKRDGKPFEIADFMPRFDASRDDQQREVFDKQFQRDVQAAFMAGRPLPEVSYGLADVLAEPDLETPT